MQYSGAAVSERAVRRRVERFFERQEFENGVESGGGDVVLSPNSLVPSPSSITPRDTDPFTDSSTTPPGYAKPSLYLSTTPPHYPTSKDSSITKARNKSIEKLPYWMSKGKTSYDMTKRKKRKKLDMNRENLNDQSIKCYNDTQYSSACNEATIELSTNIYRCRVVSQFSRALSLFNHTRRH